MDWRTEHLRCIPVTSSYCSFFQFGFLIISDNAVPVCQVLSRLWSLSCLAWIPVIRVISLEATIIECHKGFALGHKFTCDHLVVKLPCQVSLYSSRRCFAFLFFVVLEKTLEKNGAFCSLEFHEMPHLHYSSCGILGV